MLDKDPDTVGKTWSFLMRRDESSGWLWTEDKFRTGIIELNRDIFIPELN